MLLGVSLCLPLSKLPLMLCGLSLCLPLFPCLRMLSLMLCRLSLCLSCSCACPCCCVEPSSLLCASYEVFPRV